MQFLENLLAVFAIAEMVVAEDDLVVIFLAQPNSLHSAGCLIYLVGAQFEEHGANRMPELCEVINNQEIGFGEELVDILHRATLRNHLTHST